MENFLKISKADAKRALQIAQYMDQYHWIKLYDLDFIDDLRNKMLWGFETFELNGSTAKFERQVIMMLLMAATIGGAI